MKNSLLLLFVTSFGFFSLNYADSDFPGYEDITYDLNDAYEQESDDNNQASVEISNFSTLNLWGRSLNFENSNKSDLSEAFTDWADRVKVSMGITPRDATSISTRKELYALRKFLSKFVNYEQSDKNHAEAKKLNRRYNYFLHLERLADKLNKKGWSSQFMTVNQVMKLHSQSWSSKTNRTDDILNVRDILHALYSSIEQLGGSVKAPFLDRFRTKIYQLVSIAIRVQSKSSSDEKAQYLLQEWEKLRTSEKPSKVLDFPWSEIANNQFGLGRFKTAISYAMTLANYFQLTYRQFFSVETMMWFGENAQMLSALDQLYSVRGEISLLEIENSYTADKGRLTITELVRFTRNQPQFRELARVLYTRYLDSLSEQSVIKEQVIAMRDKVLKIRSMQRIEQLIADKNEHEIKEVLDNFEQRTDIAKLLSPLLMIENTDGVDFTDIQKNEFFTNTGLQYSKIIQTGGDRDKLIRVVRETFPQRSSDPEFVKDVLQKVSDEIQRQTNTEATLGLLETARYRHIVTQVIQEPGATELFEVREGTLVVKTIVLKAIREGDSSGLVDLAFDKFNNEFIDTEKKLEGADVLSVKLNKEYHRIEFLEQELKLLGQRVSATESEGVSEKIKSWQNQLRAEQSKVRNNLRDLESLGNKFDLLRSRLAQLIGAKSQLILTDTNYLNTVLQSYLKRLLSNGRNFQTSIKAVINLLAELKEKSNEIKNLADSISASRNEVRKIALKIDIMGDSLSEKLPLLKERRALLEERHSLIYRKVSYLSVEEQNHIDQNASMTAEFDENVANQYASKYLIGFIRKGDTQNTVVENIRFHSFGGSSISFDLTLMNTQVSEDWEKVERRQTISLKVSPKVVKSEPDNFDFEIQSLVLRKEGEDPVELKTGLKLVLESTLDLLNLLVKALNDTPYRKLKFKYFPHLETIRVINGLPIFESFPNFKVDFIKLLNKKIYIYGDVSGERLGSLVGKGLVMTKGKKIQVDREDSKSKEDFKRMESQGSFVVGQAKIRINEKLINDFYKGMRRAVISEKSSGTHDFMFFEGLQKAEIYFEENDEVNMLFKGDFRTISKSTRRFYSLINGIASPYLGLKEGLARAGSGLLRFVTFGKVNVEVDPKNYRSPSGEFAIFLAGQSKYQQETLNVNFDTVSLYDPVHMGALQPYLGTAKVIMTVTRAVGWLYKQLVKMIDAIPGLNVQTPKNRLDHMLLTWLVANLAYQIDSKVQDLNIEVKSFKSFELELNDFELVEGVETKVAEIKIFDQTMEITSTAKSQL